MPLLQLPVRKAATSSGKGQVWEQIAVPVVPDGWAYAQAKGGYMQELTIAGNALLQLVATGLFVAVSIAFGCAVFCVLVQKGR